MNTVLGKVVLYKWRHKDLTKKQNLREFITTRPTSQEMSTGVL